MSKYLTTTTEAYRVDSENEAAELINEAKESNKWILQKYSSVKKEKKKNGEVLDEYYLVSLVKQFNNVKEPTSEVSVSYEVEF